MNKKHSKKAIVYFSARILSVLLSVFLILNMAEIAYADQVQLPQINRWPSSLTENTERTVSENTLKVKAVGINNPQGIRLTGLVLTNLDKPAEGKPYDTTATVTSRENISWDVPVYWIDSTGRAVDEPTAGKECYPLIVFFVPDGYATDGLLELTPYLSDVFRKTNGVLSIVDYERGVTYITGNIWELDAPGYAVRENSSAGETYDESGEYRPDNKPDDSSKAAAPEHPEDIHPTDKPEQPGRSEGTDEPKKPETEESDEPKEPETEEPDEPKEPEAEEPDEPDLYAAFAEKYRKNDYENIPWAEELEAFGGIDQVDFVRLIKACGGYTTTSWITKGLTSTFAAYMENLELITALNNARKEVAQEIYDQADPFIKAHTTDKDLVARSDQESLLQFFHMVVDNLIPQATQMLRENFPAFSAADDECFSRELGVAFTLSASDADAYTENSYEKSDDFHVLLTFCVESYIKNRFDTQSLYTFALTEKDRNMPLLKDTVLHEMVHVFMSDYNRNGESFINYPRKTENGNYFIPGIGEVTPKQLSKLRDTLNYPSWFSEGSAALISTTFNRNDNYVNAMRANEGDAFSASGLYEFSQDRYLTLDVTDPYFAQNDVYNNYIFGALAVMYMGEMYNRKTTGTSTVLLDADGKATIDTMAVRDGISAILERMHNGETLDSVFADISDGKYKDTQDFCDKYFDMDGPNTDTLSYAANVLNYIDNLSRETGTTITGSILKPFDENVLDLFDVSKAASTDIYVVQDGAGFVKSTVSDEITCKTGGKSDPSEMLSLLNEQNSDEELNGSADVSAAETEAGAGAETDSKPEMQDISTEESVSPETGAEATPAEQESEETSVEQESEEAPVEQESEAASDELDSEAA